MSRFIPALFRNRKGVVLALVLGAVSLLTLVAVESAHRASLDGQRGARSTREFAFRRAFDSGIQAAKGLIVEGRKQKTFDTSNDPWSRPLKLELGSGEFVTVQVFDESGKLSLTPLLSQSATSTQGTAQNSNGTAGATGTAGTNNSNASNKNSERDAALQGVTRLFEQLRNQDESSKTDWNTLELGFRTRLGISSDPLTGTSAPKDSRNASANPQPATISLVTLDGFREADLSMAQTWGQASPDGRQQGLYDFFTLVGDGKVNFNTASVPVLRALDEKFTLDIAKSIVAWRGGDASGSSESPNVGNGSSSTQSSNGQPFKTLKEVEQVPGVVTSVTVDGKLQTISLLDTLKNKVSVSSSAFSAILSAEVDGRLRTAVVYFDFGSSTSTANNNTKATPQAAPVSGSSVRIVAYEELEQ